MQTHKNYETLIVYFKNLREKARRGGWVNKQKFWFMEDVAFELALENQMTAEHTKQTFTTCFTTGALLHQINKILCFGFPVPDQYWTS